MSEALVGRGIRCLLFDLGDTLWYREDQDHWEKREDAANQQAITLLRRYTDSSRLPKLDDRSLGRQLRRAFDAQIRAAIRRAPLLEPDPVQPIATILQEWGLDEIDSALCVSLFEALRVRIPNSRPLFSDTLSTLAELRRRGYLLGVITNRLWGGEAFHEDLRAIGLLDYFDHKHIAISGELGIRKPNPQIFQYALNALQASPQETAMIGDSLSADILGAQPLGIYAIWKPKPWLREWALKHAITQPGQAMIQHQLISSGAFPGEDTADTQLAEAPNSGGLPRGLYVTDDDYILARANTSRDYLEQFRNGEIRPDRVIAHLADLLEIFPEAGKP
ncbi:MAG TPA: HAD family hydrolase [Ktedonobacteraceae bacterium]|jgi:HAD superfamily hydrolase (TIGR01509 family)|nr:HAD family hydrolase [Ktedonobacteraceae bacterium]